MMADRTILPGTEDGRQPPNDAVFIHDAMGRILELNQRIARMLGFAEAALEQVDPLQPIHAHSTYRPGVTHGRT
jgi:PAS domain-containing protein